MPDRHTRTKLGAMSVGGLTALALLAPLTATPAQAAPVSNIPTINITMADVPEKNSFGYLHSNKSNKIKTTMTVEDPAGAVGIASPVGGEIKGRGNYTWGLPKKPYQIKFDDNTPVLGMEASKTWILLANNADASLMRNKLAYDFAAAIGMKEAPDSRWADVRIDNTYMGNYLVSEKVEVKKNRLDLKHEQGVLVELDNNYGTAEDYYFRTGTKKDIFVLKDAKSDLPDKPAPLPATTQAGWVDIQASLNRFDALINAPTVDWNAISQVIDIDSFVRYYWVYEMTANPEITQSSIFFYKDGPTDKLHAGPVWDFDSSLGSYDRARQLGSEANGDYAKAAKVLRTTNSDTVPRNGWYTELFKQPQFVERARQMWDQGIGWHANNLTNKINEYENGVKQSAARNFSNDCTACNVLGKSTLLIPGWGKSYSSTYAGEVSYLRNWVGERSKMLLREQAAPLLRYRAHVQDIGWQGKVNYGQAIGTAGQSKRVEAFELETPGSSVINSIQGNAHIQDIGWQGWRTATNIGTSGQAKRVEALQFRLTGNDATKYDIFYRAHVQEDGWQAWVSNGATAGTSGQSKRIEAVQIRLQTKSTPTPGVPVTGTPTPSATPTPTPTPSATPTPSVTPTATPTPTVTPTATPTPTVTPTATPTSTPTTAPVGTTTYRVHSQDIGWTGFVTNGASAGQVGKRVEALDLKATSPGITGDISYRGHVQDLGWQEWRGSGKRIGSESRGLRLEAFEVKLTGQLATKFDIRYRSYIQGSGWQNWVTNGALSGTSGKSLQIQQVEIQLVPKG